MSIGFIMQKYLITIHRFWAEISRVVVMDGSLVVPYLQTFISQINLQFGLMGFSRCYFLKQLSIVLLSTYKPPPLI
jgi:hypothetical protein